MTLGDLRVKEVWGSCDASSLLQALRQNGSLHAACAWQCGVWDRRIAADCDRNRRASRIVQTLEDEGLMRCSVDIPIDSILQQLQSYRCLRKLSIAAVNFPVPLLDDTIGQPLSSFLCSGVPLESVELRGFRLRRDQFVPLLLALHSCPSLVRLVLIGNMEIEAAREMAALFRQPRVSSLRELCLGSLQFHESATEMTSMFTPLDGSPQHSSVGALLQVLELRMHIHDIQILVEALADQRCQLRTLSLRSLNEKTSKQLIRHLPEMINLRELHVKYVYGECDLSSFLRTFRKNGSLQTVSLGDEDGGPLLSTADFLHIQSYCDRNRWAAGSLQNPEDDGLMCRVDATVLPSLWHAVKPARRMAPSVLLASLLACNEAIGLYGRAKRFACNR
jgi:hypothetical protein